MGGLVTCKEIESADGVSYSRQSCCPLTLMNDLNHLEFARGGTNVLNNVPDN